MQFNEEFEVSICCPNCGEYHSIYVERADFYKWCRSKYTSREIFPYLTSYEIDFIDTGLCPICWNKLYKKESA